MHVVIAIYVMKEQDGFVQCRKYTDLFFIEFVISKQLRAYTHTHTKNTDSDVGQPRLQ